MGSKRRLAPAIAAMVADMPDGPLLDVFAGMCAVGRTVAPYRQIWTNDLQHFSQTVARSIFCASSGPPTGLSAAALVNPAYHQNLAFLERRFSDQLRQEDSALKAQDLPTIELLGKCLRPEKLQTDNELPRLRRLPGTFPYRLFSLLYSQSYFSLRQCASIDSLRYAFDALLKRGDIGLDTHRWFCLALCQALSRSTTSPGHFAQPLRPKIGNLSRFVTQRRKSLWSEWLRALSTLGPIGSQRWRKKNKYFGGNSNDVLVEILGERILPSVVYADPPYTKDQYSRYYHIYETLLLYDYPSVAGTGCCRTGRVSSEFSLKTKVEAAMASLIERTANLGASLVLSYPANGLLPHSRVAIPALLKGSFRTVHKPIEIAHLHSAMGASKGVDRYPVLEVVYRAEI